MQSSLILLVISISMHAGSDYTAPPPQRNGGLDQNGNLRWGRDGATLPNVAYEVTILNDDIPEPVEVVEVMVQCVATENCYLPRTRYTITIIDDQGECENAIIIKWVTDSCMCNCCKCKNANSHVKDKYYNK